MLIKIFLYLSTIFFIVSCAFLDWKGSRRVKIVTTALGGSSQKAMYEAYLKNLAVQADFGCHPDKGMGNAIFKRIGGAYIGEATYSIQRKLCTNYKPCDGEWAKQESRTQGNGWIWYPSKATDSNLYKADLRAKGFALEQLTQECEVIPKDARFHERCVENNGGNYLVKVRVSVKNKSCALAKTGQLAPHKKLTKILRSFRKELNL